MTTQDIDDIIMIETNNCSQRRTPNIKKGIVWYVNMLSMQQKRLRRENYCEDNSIVPFSEKTCDYKTVKITHYGTIQDLYDYEYEQENCYEE